MPEQVTENTPTTETTPEQKPVTAREQLYQKLGYGEEPEKTPEPAKEEPPKPEAPDFEALLSRATEPLVAKIAELEQKLAPPPPKPAEPAKKALVDYLREGDVEGFEKALIETVESRVSERVTGRAKEESLAEFQVQQTLNTFLNDVRKDNADIMEEEPWITSIAAAKLQAAQSAGKIKDAESYVSAYQSSVKEAIDEVRKRIQRYRANGKDEALTTKREVISSSPLKPNSIAERGEPSQTPTEPDISPGNYIAQRQRWNNQRKGLSS